MKRAFTMLGVIGVTALITFLWVTKNQSEERASQLDKRLAEAEARTAMLEGDIDTANQRLKYLSEHSRPQTTPVARQVKTSPTASKETTGEAPNAINLSVPTYTSNSRVSTVQPFPLPVPFGAGGGFAGYQFKSASGSFIRIEGTSSIHDWRAESPFIGGSGMVTPGTTITSEDASVSEPTNASVTAFVTVTSLKSVEKTGAPFSDLMDKVMYDMLRGDAYPRIIFTLESLKPKSKSQVANDTFYDARGTLAIAGVTNTINLPVTASQLSNGKVIFSGNTRLKMSDYKIDTSSISVGSSGVTIKVGDEVKVTFGWNVRATEPLQAKSGP